MAKERYVTFVVHGIGTPKSASIQVDDATKKFATTWGERNDTELKRSLYTAHPEHGDSVEYSVYEGKIANDKTQEFVEAQWADLSKAPSGYFSPVTSFFILLLDLRNISKVCKKLFKDREADSDLERSKRGGLTRWWGHYTIGFVEGPIVGLNLLLIAAFLVAIGLKTPETELWRGLWVGISGLLAIAIGLAVQPPKEKLAFKVQDRLPRNRKIWSALLAVFVTLYWVFEAPVTSWAAVMTGILGMVLSYIVIKFYPSRVFLTNSCAIGGLAFTGIAAASTVVLPPLVATVNWILNGVNSLRASINAAPLAGEPLNVAYFDGFFGYIMIILAVIAIAWLGVNIIYFFVSLGWFARRDTTGMRNKDSKSSFLPRTFDLQIFAHIFELRLWQIFIPVIWTLLLRLIPKNEEAGARNLLDPGEIDQLIQAGAAFNILNLAVFILVIIGGGLTFGQFNKKTKAGDPKNEVRLIIGNPLLTLTIVTPILFALPFIVDVFLPGVAIVDTLRDNYKVGWAIMIGIGVFAFLQREGLKNGIDFALDVTMYFNKEQTVREDKDKTRAVVYDKIISRMETIVNDVINRRDEDGNKNLPTKVLFLTHSQGTALTRHFLAEQYEPNGLDSYFVTMGSPVSHIYQNYFLTSLWHGELNPNLMEKRDSKPARWLNMNRKSDYIGRKIDDETFIVKGEEKALNVENVPNDAVEDEKGNVGPWHGGHTGYFVDHVVHKELEGRGMILKSAEADAPDDSEEMTASFEAQSYPEPTKKEDPSENEDSDS